MLNRLHTELERGHGEMVEVVVAPAVANFGIDYLRAVVEREGRYELILAVGGLERAGQREAGDSGLIALVLPLS